jgi:ankyrin repeat protein
MAHEYIEYQDAHRIQKLHLDASELATWKLIKLMRPTFDTEHRHPVEIKISKKKDLLIASQVGHLLSQGAYPRAYCYQGYPLLACAAAWRMPLVAQLLLKAGADPNDSPCPLWYAKGAKVTRVLLSHGADPDIKTKDGRVALMPFCRYSSIGKVRALLEAGADPNIAQTDGHKGFTPLICYMFRLTKNNNLAIVKLLLDGGADRTMQIEAYGGQYGNKKMITAEDIARKQNWHEAIDLLSKPQKIA